MLKTLPFIPSLVIVFVLLLVASCIPRAIRISYCCVCKQMDHPACYHDGRILLDMSQCHPAARRVDYLCAFGMVTDIQYANLPDGTNWNGTQKRYFRHSLQVCVHTPSSIH